MKKSIAILLAAVITSLAACGSPSTPSSPSDASGTQTGTQEGQPQGGDTASSEEPVTIKFANYAILEEGYTAFWEGVKEGFEARHPHITIEWVTAPYGEIMTQVINMAGGGDRVDLMFGELDWTPVMEDTGLSVPVDTVLSQEFLSDFYPNVLDAHRVNDELFAIPLYVSPFVLYYNRNILERAGFDAPPATYDEMLAMGEVISQLQTDDGNPIFTFGQATASRPVSGAALTGMIYNFGGELLAEDGSLSIDNDGFNETFEMLALLEERGYNPQNALLRDLRNLFALEQLAMYYDQSWGFNGVSSINPDAASFAATAAPLAGGNGDGYSILQAHVLMFMDNGEARREATRLFTEYLLTWEVLGDYMTSLTPAYPAMRSMEGRVSPMLSGAADSIEKTKPIAFVPELTDLYLELCAMAQSVTVGGRDVASAITEFRNAAHSILN